MIKKTHWLAGMTIGCVLSTPAALAEEYRGFYFGVWGGSGSVDMPSKAAFDDAMEIAVPAELDAAGDALTTATREVLFELSGTGRSTLDDTVSVWGLQLGYRFNKFFAAEVGYANLGEAAYRLPMAVDYTDTTFNAAGAVVGVDSGTLVAERSSRFSSAGPTLSALGMLPIGQHFEFHARGGIYLADTRLTGRIRDAETGENLIHRRTDASETELFAGIGGAWSINENFTLRAEYQKFLDVGGEGKTGESDIDVFNLSVLFK
jgi:OmpA-OmpF porin, OOP family